MKPLALFPATLMVSLGLGLCSSVVAQSQPQPTTRPAAFPAQFEAFVKSVDKDGDGRITRSEAGGAKWFEFADANKDGVIDAKELGTIRAARAGRSGSAPAAPLGQSTDNPPQTQLDSTAARASAEDIAIFEKRIRPVLANRCYQCHSAEAKELKAGLALDARAAVLKGGDSGPAVVPDILHLLGLEHTKLTYRYAGRDMRLTDVKGNVVKGIIA